MLEHADKFALAHKVVVNAIVLTRAHGACSMRNRYLDAASGIDKGFNKAGFARARGRRDSVKCTASSHKIRCWLK